MNTLRPTVRCSRCRIEDEVYAMDRLDVGVAASGAHIYDWKHKTIDGCLLALGTAVALLRGEA